MNLAEAALRPGLAAPDRLAMSIIGLSRADRWSQSRLRQTVLRRAAALTGAGIEPGTLLFIPECAHPENALNAVAAIAAGIVPVLCALPQHAPEIPRIAASAPMALLADSDRPHHGTYSHFIDRDALARTESPALSVFAPGMSQPSAWLRTRPEASGQIRVQPGALPCIDVTAQDRILLTPGIGPTLPAGLLTCWAESAAVLIPEAGITPGQWPLLGGRHGATVLVAGAQDLQRLLAQDWNPWPGLRQAIVTDGPATPTLLQLWQAHSRIPLHMLV